MTALPPSCRASPDTAGVCPKTSVAISTVVCDRPRRDNDVEFEDSVDVSEGESLNWADAGTSDNRKAKEGGDYRTYVENARVGAG